MLVADDDDELRGLVAGLLRRRGFAVVTASSCADAVAIAVSQKPDVCLFDLEMPGASGTETARRVRAHDDLSTIPVLLMTTRPLDDDLRREAECAGCVDVLDKAEALPTLREHITAALLGGGRFLTPA